MKRLRELWVPVLIGCPLLLILLWGLVSAGAGLVLDGILFSLEQPVSVIEVEADYVRVRISGRSALGLDARVTRTLICESCASTLPHSRVNIKRGQIEGDWTTVILPVDPNECGQCRIEGALTYPVPGLIWPLSYEYHTDWFEPVRGSDAGEN